MNKLARLALSAASATALLVAARPASAWDSICYEFPDITKTVASLDSGMPGARGCEGIEAARGRFRDPVHHLDEHRLVLERAIQQAKLPAALLETIRLPVLSSDFPVYGKNGSTTTVAPQKPEPGWSTRGVYRSYALDEMAQLPDFSFALWDWGGGNESCPLSPLPSGFDDAQKCHQFTTHMGATNSNHFPPQSDSWFAYYHGLAKTRAAECTATRNAIWNAAPLDKQAARDGRLAPFFRACEIEALTYEAVAQHFLQDSWSAGHMWQRWGSTTLDAMPDVPAKGQSQSAGSWNILDVKLRKLLVSEIVAVSAGTIHGSDPPLWEKPGGITLHDELCYPSVDVTCVDNGNVINVAGDLHLHDVIGGVPAHSEISSLSLPYSPAVLGAQGQRLLDCAAGAVGAVYQLLSDDMTFKNPVLGKAGQAAPPFDPNDCHAPAVTNRAFNAGLEWQDLQPAFGEWLAVLSDNIPDSVEGLARNDYGELRHAAAVLAKLRPDETQMSTLRLKETFHYDDELCDKLTGYCTQITYTAEPALFTMLKTEPNRCYDKNADREGCTVGAPKPADPIAPFADPEITGPIADLDPATPVGAQAIVFHASRAAQLCNAVTAANLDTLKLHVTVANDADLPATCDVCAEWTAPFLRIGTDDMSYDHSAEPLCSFVAADPASVEYVYEPAQGTADLFALARRHCGCKGLVAGTDAGLQRLVTKPTLDGNITIVPTGLNVPVGVVPRSIAAASGQTLLVATGSGQIVGVRDDAEIDLNPMNGIDRLDFTGVSDISAITVVNADGKELLLAVTPGTGELIAWDLTSKTQCDRFSVAQVAGQGAYGVVTTADGSTVFVSLRGAQPLSGAVALIDIPAIAKCDGSAVNTRQWLTTPGAAAGLGPMALAPDGSKLAVGGRLGATCIDQIKAANGTTTVDTQVGCDRVFVLDVATKTWLQFGINLSMPTRPAAQPQGVAWFGDSTRLAFASKQGISNGGNGDSGWPANWTAAPRIPVGGTLRLGDTSSATYMGGGGLSPRYWTYNMPLADTVLGPTVVVDGGASGGPAWVFVGTNGGRIAAYRVEQHDATADSIWEGRNADPETGLHVSTNGGWYGGCSHACSLVGNVCPAVCPGNQTPLGFGYVELGSNVRVLTAY